MVYNDILNNYSINMKKVLRLILESGGITRNQLISLSKLSVMTLTKFVMQFIDDGIIIEFGCVQSTGGRKPTLLVINPHFAYIIGIDIGSRSVKIGMVGLNGEILDKELILGETDFKNFFSFPPEKLIERIEKILSKYPEKRVIGISIGISGLVDSENGHIIFCPNIKEWSNMDVKGILEKRFKIPVFVDTSARCLARVENQFGFAKDIQDSVYISMGCSITAGILIQGKVYEGDGFAGEIGHIKVAEGEADECTCGNKGCLEIYATLPMILYRIHKRLKEYSGYSPAKEMIVDEYSLENVIKALETGDKVIFTVIDEISVMIGTALSAMSNILNPSVIILGGSVIESFPMMTDNIFRVIRQRSLLTTYRNLEVKQSAFGWEGGILGSAIRIINMVFD